MYPLTMIKQENGKAFTVYVRSKGEKELQEKEGFLTSQDYYNKNIKVKNDIKKDTVSKSKQEATKRTRKASKKVSSK